MPRGRPKGYPKSGGRAKGVLNKTTTTVRESILEVFRGLGGSEAMQKWALTNPQAYYQIYARLIPQEHVGEGGEGPVKVTVHHHYE